MGRGSEIHGTVVGVPVANKINRKPLVATVFYNLQLAYC